jgi:copper(I)-binding protein
MTILQAGPARPLQALAISAVLTGIAISSADARFTLASNEAEQNSGYTMVAQVGGQDHQQGASTAASADTFKVGDITVASPWTRATPGGAKVAGGYLKVTNNGAAADKLVGGATDISGRVEIHEMAMSGGVMQMRPLNEGLELKAGQAVELKPGGYHMMFLDLKRQLKEGETVKATLQFEKAGKVDVTFRVGPVGGASAPEHKH